MRKHLVIAIFLLVGIASPAYAQVQYSVGNFMRYGNGEQMVGGMPRSREYIENQMNVRLFWNSFTMGFEYLYDNPPEFGPSYIGLRKRWVEFAKKGLELRVGDYYTLYGKGLSMNLFENRALNYDTRLDGIRGTYRNKYVKALFAMGQMDYIDLLRHDRIEVYDVTSGHVTIKPFRALHLGASLLGVTGELPTAFGIDQVTMEMPEFMATFRGGGFELFGQYAIKNSNIISPRADGTTINYDSDGNAFYGAASYTSDIGLGITFDYKDYRYDVVDEEHRDANRASRMLPMANPPIVHKEHYFTLLSRNPHLVDFNDEIGAQVDVFYSMTPEITINLNGAVASRHDGYRTNNGLRVTYKRETEFLPSMDEQFSPFYEMYGEVEWYFDGDSYLRAAFNRRYDAPYENNLAHVQSSWTLPLRVEYVLTPDYSLGVNLEQQWFHDSFAVDKPDYYNQFVALTINRSSQWSATLRFEYTTDTGVPMGTQFWRAIDLSYRLGTEHLITLMYGTERGGLICTNGICREVLPFDGVRFSLLSQL